MHQTMYRSDYSVYVYPKIQWRISYEQPMELSVVFLYIIDYVCGSSGKGILYLEADGSDGNSWMQSDDL